MIHVFLGTKAQYIKTAPILRSMDEQGVRYNLIDSGQHDGLTETLRRELGLRRPDVRLRAGKGDITSVPRALLWGIACLGLAVFRARLIRKRIFRNEGGICLIHGDTQTTLISMIFARRAGIKVGHLESGLTSHHYFNPFPEELIRKIVMKGSDILFAFSDSAFRNMETMRLRGEKYNLKVNTNVEALAFSLEQTDFRTAPVNRYCVATIHRVETVHNRDRMQKVVDLLESLSESRQVLFVLHPSTRMRLQRYGLLDRLEGRPGMTLLPLQPHRDFIQMLKAAELVVTDGGSIQEECFYLNVPCLVMRTRTERLEGLGANAFLSGFKQDRIRYFLDHREKFCSNRARMDVSPSARLVDYVRAYE